MTTVRITHGQCGHTTTVRVEDRGKGERFSVAISSDCKNVMKMARELKDLEKVDAFRKYAENPVYRAAAKHLRHVACPVPGGILMALEVEAGLNVAKDSKIEFTEAGHAG